MVLRQLINRGTLIKGYVTNPGSLKNFENREVGISDHNNLTVCDKEDQVQSMESIPVNEFNKSALIQMTNLTENY